jgi:hypothetical protein
MPFSALRLRLPIINRPSISTLLISGFDHLHSYSLPHCYLLGAIAKKLAFQSLYNMKYHKLTKTDM